jgi:membrane-associated phospholipid phosphatase
MTHQAEADRGLEPAGTGDGHTTYAPLERGPVALRLVGGGLLLALALTAVGHVVTGQAVLSSFLRREESVSRWFVAQRTPTLDTATHIGSYLSETVTCIALLVVVILVLRAWLGRWRESWAVFAAIVGELLVFLIVTALVDRARPAVTQLDAAPPTSSFPSGHVGAAVALYGCIAVVAHREVRHRRLAALVVAVCCVVPVVVALSRVYRGMHFVSDVLFGAVGGGLWLLLVVTTLLALPRPEPATVTELRPGRRGAGSAVA